MNIDNPNDIPRLSYNELCALKQQFNSVYSPPDTKFPQEHSDFQFTQTQPRVFFHAQRRKTPNLHKKVKLHSNSLPQCQNSNPVISGNNSLPNKDPTLINTQKPISNPPWTNLTFSTSSSPTTNSSAPPESTNSSTTNN